MPRSNREKYKRKLRSVVTHMDNVGMYLAEAYDFYNPDYPDISRDLDTLLELAALLKQGTEALEARI